jgi:Protein of unknown function (DUF4199)
MKKIILTYGLISGIISSVLMAATVPFLHKLGGNTGYIFGYTAIVLSFLLVFFGIRSYRDNLGNGQITFAKAFAIGISITLISCLFYVVTWEIIYFNFIPHFMDSYFAQAVDKIKASGASPATIQAKLADLERSKRLYSNPLYNAALTFLEPFPVGLVITLVSAAILRKKAPLQSEQAPLPAAY